MTIDEKAFEAFMLAMHENGTSGLGMRKNLEAYEAAKPKAEGDTIGAMVRRGQDACLRDHKEAADGCHWCEVDKAALAALAQQATPVQPDETCKVIADNFRESFWRWLELHPHEAAREAEDLIRQHLVAPPKEEIGVHFCTISQGKPCSICMPSYFEQPQPSPMREMSDESALMWLTSYLIQLTGNPDYLGREFHAKKIIERLGALPQWQSMDSAPTNTLKILVATKNGQLFVAWRDTRSGDGMWCYHDGDYKCYVHQPSKWRPLPITEVEDGEGR